MASFCSQISDSIIFVEWTVYGEGNPNTITTYPGGGFNPFEKSARQIGSWNPKVWGENK